MVFMQNKMIYLTVQQTLQGVCSSVQNKPLPQIDWVAENQLAAISSDFGPLISTLVQTECILGVCENQNGAPPLVR